MTKAGRGRRRAARAAWSLPGVWNLPDGTAIRGNDTVGGHSVAAGRVAVWPIASRGSNERLLIVLAHPGDITAMAGTIAVAARRGVRVTVLVLTCAARRGARVEQVARVCRALAVSELVVRCYPRGELGEALGSLPGRAELRAVMDECDPTIVLTLAPGAATGARAEDDDHSTSTRIITDLLRDPNCAPHARTVGQRTRSGTRPVSGVVGARRRSALPAPTAAVPVRAHGRVALVPVSRRCDAVAWVPKRHTSARMVLLLSRMHRLLVGNEYYVLRDRSDVEAAASLAGH